MRRAIPPACPRLRRRRAGLILLAAPLVGLIGFPFAGSSVRSVGVDRALLLGLVLLVGGAVLMLTWHADTPVGWIIATSLVNGLGIAITLVASATDALSQFTPEEAGTGSALFNSLRQLGAAMGVGIPVAFEFVAAGRRTPDAALAGSGSAFAIRLIVLAIPLILLVVVSRRRPHGRRVVIQ